MIAPSITVSIEPADSTVSIDSEGHTVADNQSVSVNNNLISGVMKCKDGWNSKNPSTNYYLYLTIKSDDTEATLMFEESSGDDSVSGPLDNYSALSSSGYVEKVSDNVYRISSESFSRLSLYAEKGGVSGKKTQLDTLIDSDGIQMVYDWVTVPSFVITPRYYTDNMQNVGFELAEGDTKFTLTEGSVVCINRSDVGVEWAIAYDVIFSPSFPDAELWMSYLDDTGERASIKMATATSQNGTLTRAASEMDARIYVKTETMVGSEKTIDLTNMLIRYARMQSRLDIPDDTATFNGVPVSLTQEKDAEKQQLTIYPDENQEYFLILRYTAWSLWKSEPDRYVSTACGRIKAYNRPVGSDINIFDIPVEYQDGKNYVSYGELVKIGPIPETYFSVHSSGVKIINRNDLSFYIYSDDPPYVDDIGWPVAWLTYDSDDNKPCQVVVSDTPKTQQSEVAQNE